VAVADHRQHRGGCRRAHARQPHQLPGPLVLARDGLDVLVVDGDAFIEPVQLAQQVADDGVGPAGQVLQGRVGLAPHGRGLERQHDAQLAEQAAQAVDRGSARLDVALTRAMHHQPRLLVDNRADHILRCLRMQPGSSLGT
jgi:hypothetical protein